MHFQVFRPAYPTIRPSPSFPTSITPMSSYHDESVATYVSSGTHYTMSLAQFRSTTYLRPSTTSSYDLFYTEGTVCSDSPMARS